MTKAELEKKIAVLENECATFKRRADFATTELMEISQGIACKPYWHNEGSTSWEKVLRWRAAKAVEKIALMVRP